MIHDSNTFATKSIKILRYRHPSVFARLAHMSPKQVFGIWYTISQ